MGKTAVAIALTESERRELEAPFPEKLRRVVG